MFKFDFGVLSDNFHDIAYLAGMKMDHGKASSSRYLSGIVYFPTVPVSIQVYDNCSILNQ
jgi:hypothetical protein